jgi:NADH-quinone oxidoreductase subunit L
MEGPTPVSALIHAATMVTAGVYMIARSAPLYSRAPETLFIIAVVGISTALLAALIATVQRDIKKVLAYSTISQLGYMFLAIGVGAFGAGVFHLLTHAFFKALLFLGSGSVILALHHEQDLFNMGGLRKYLPVTFFTMWMGAFALAGVPLFSGFFSKDAILWETFAAGNEALWLMGVVVAGLTAFYISRLMFLAFHGRERSEKQHQGPPDLSPKEPSWSVTLPLIILACFSLLAGYLGLPSYWGSNRLEEFLAPSFRFQFSGQPAAAIEHAHLTEVILTLVTLAVAFFGFALAYHFYIKDPQVAGRLANRFSWLYALLRRKFFVDEIYDWLLDRKSVV